MSLRIPAELSRASPGCPLPWARPRPGLSEPPAQQVTPHQLGQQRPDGAALSFHPHPGRDCSPVTPHRADAPGLVCPSAPEGSDQTIPEAAQGPAPACPVLRRGGLAGHLGPWRSPQPICRTPWRRGKRGLDPRVTPQLGIERYACVLGFFPPQGQSGPLPLSLGDHSTWP